MCNEIPEGCATIASLCSRFKICRKTVMKLMDIPDSPKPKGIIKNKYNLKIDYFDIQEFGDFIMNARREKLAQQIEKPPFGCAGKSDLRKHLKCSFERIEALIENVKPLGYYKVIGRKNPYYSIDEVLALHKSIPTIRKLKNIAYETEEKWEVPQHTDREIRQCQLFNMINKQIAQTLRAY